MEQEPNDGWDTPETRKPSKRVEFENAEPSRRVPATPPEYVIGVGSSAGGIEALVELLSGTPENSENAYVIVQHMSPDFKTMLPDILSRQCPHDVNLAFEGTTLRPGSIYLAPPNKILTIFHGRLFLEDRIDSDPNSFFPIDYFFKSLAKDCGNRAIGLILSGTGSDGAKGIREIRKNSGYVIAQAPESAKFSGMPKSAIASKAPNSVLDLKDIAGHITDYTSGVSSPLKQQLMIPPNKNSVLDKVFFYLRNRHGVDFSGYLEDLVNRRIARRAKIVGCTGLDEYCEHLSKSLKELDALHDDLLLGVTEFNRHPESLEQIKNQVFPELAKLESKDTIRVWVVGCSTGEEAYTISFMLSDYLKQIKSPLDFKTFATDIDQKSLKFASRAFYPKEKIASLPVSWQKNYFRIKDGQAYVKTSIRERVVFANHNIIDDAPFPAIDFITCRNLFIYFKPEVKEKILKSFRFSLKDKGYLALGPSESIPSNNHAFKEMHEEAKLFQCISPGSSFTSNIEKTKDSLSATNRKHNIESNISKKKEEQEAYLNKLYRKLVHEHLPASLIFNEDLAIEYFFGPVKEYLVPISGMASHFLNDTLPPDVFEVVSSLKSSLSDSVRENFSTIHVSRAPDRDQLLAVRVVDLQTENKGKKLYLVKFRLQENLVTSDNLQGKIPTKHEAKIRSLEKELRKTKAQLEDSKSEMISVIGQLEASNEEMRATNEELQSGSEELQSTNEELQAVNEELYTVNAECQMRITELSEMSSDVHNIYEVSEIGTMFVDKNLRIRKFNAPSQKIFNFLPDDIGRPVEHFSSTLKIDFTKKIKSVLKTMRMYQREIVSNSGVTYLMRIAPYRTDDLQIKGTVLVFIDITSMKKIQKDLHDMHDDLTLVTEETSDLVVRFDGRGRLLYANESFKLHFGSDDKASIPSGKGFTEFIHEDDRGEMTRLIKEWRKHKIVEDTFKIRQLAFDGDTMNIIWHIKAKFDQKGSFKHFVSIGHIEN